MQSRRTAFLMAAVCTAAPITNATADVADDFKTKYGVSLSAASGLAPGIASGENTLEKALRGYNYEIVWNGGKAERVIVSGRNGSGNAAIVKLPKRYHALKAGSVTPLVLSRPTRSAMARGKPATLELPDGSQAFDNDNTLSAPNGDVTWVGSSGNTRAIITIGRSEVVGMITTGETIYHIETADGATWMVDMKKAGLEPVPLVDDAIVPPTARLATVPAGVSIELQAPTYFRVAEKQAVRWTYKGLKRSWIATLRLKREGIRPVIIKSTRVKKGGIVWKPRRAHSAEQALLELCVASQGPEPNWETCDTADIVVLPKGGLIPTPTPGPTSTPTPSPTPTPGPTSSPTPSPTPTPGPTSSPTPSPTPTPSPSAHQIDLLVYKRTDLTDTKVNQVIAVANQAYVDSKVAMTLRLVGIIPVDTPVETPLSTTLTEMFNRQGVFADLTEQRSAHGADLVTFIKAVNLGTDAICGRAYLNGYGGTALNASLPLSVVHYGYDATYNGTCLDTTLAHEVGHNEGSTHDSANAQGSSGLYPYSYGFCVTKVAGDIMSYCGWSTKTVFSSPNINVIGDNGNTLTLGIPNEADNVRSFNNIASEIENFVPNTDP